MFLQSILLAAFGATSTIRALVAPLPAMHPRTVPTVETISTVAATTPKNLTVFELPSMNVITDVAQSAAAAVCVVGGLETAGAACIGAGILAGIAFIMNAFYVGWTLYNETPGVPVTTLPRSTTDAPIITVHSNYTPTANCSVKCQLEAATPQQTWVHFGNATTEDKLHQMSYYQSGALRGVRLAQYNVAPVSKRQTFTVGEGFTQETNWLQTVYWTDDSETAFDDWNAPAFNGPAATVAGNYFYDNNVELGCFDLNDDDGTVFQSVWVIDDTDTEITLTDAAVNEYLVDCYNLDPYANVVAGENHADTASMEHLDLLIDCVTEIYAPTTQRLLPLLEHGKITYDLLWALFKPNTPVYTTCFGTKKPRCVIYDSAEEMINMSKKKYLSMDCRFFDFDGKTFGMASIELRIPKFRLTKRIDTLLAFPLKYYLDEKQVKSDLVECSRKFGEPVKFFVDSRVMIDADFFWKINPNYTRPRSNLARASPGSGQAPPPGGPPGRDRVNDGIEPADLTEDDFLICCPTVPSFSLNEKLWAEFTVADIENIKWSLSLYACLSILDKQRDVIIALVEARMDPSVVFDDFVRGKGKSLIVLLQYGSTPLLLNYALTSESSPLGVGKTFTVEAVSEHLKRPLYSLCLCISPQVGILLGNNVPDDKPSI
ncbi:uncharacterized protein PAC_19834 [Phialocephala subalpina]|uniref:DUF7025 domain-containing protein n=1 Tax=Phialocephala subalpina TaxID=576137 RepID=A0A1L7XXY5_9HELO|nr:uncharacterized protein PAC_19834 [Phialocephala subalpina]